jgi:hypothetical protein
MSNIYIQKIGETTTDLRLEFISFVVVVGQGKGDSLGFRLFRPLVASPCRPFLSRQQLSGTAKSVLIGHHTIPLIVISVSVSLKKRRASENLVYVAEILVRQKKEDNRCWISAKPQAPSPNSFLSSASCLLN